MEGQNQNVGEAVGQQHIDPLFHLGGGLLGEGQREDLLGPGPLGGDQMRDAVRDDAGFARTGPGNDEQRALAVGHGPTLGVVEVGEDSLLGRAGGGGLPNHGPLLTAWTHRGSPQGSTARASPSHGGCRPYRSRRSRLPIYDRPGEWQGDRRSYRGRFGLW